MVSKLRNNYLPEIDAFLFGRKKPGMVTVNLTRKCNQRCIYCEIGSNEPIQKKDVLRVKDLFWIIDQMEIIGIPKLALCGGEPFLFEGIFEVIAYAGEKSIYCSITTNGMNVHQLGENQLATLKNNKAQINLSIDSLEDSIQGLTRGHPLALKNVLKSFEKLSKHNLQVTVLCAISKYNYHDLSNFVYMAIHKGIKQIIFQPIIYYSNYPDQPALKNKSALNVEKENIPVLMEELNKIQKLEKETKLDTNVYRIMPWIRQYLETASGQNGAWFFEGIVPRFHCREIHAVIDISYDGSIQPCGLAPASVSIMENRPLGLLSLWKEATQPIQKDIKNQHYRDYCNGCCHKFSRNMMASAIKYPAKNRQVLSTLFVALILRAYNKTRKKLKNQQA